MSLKDTWQDLQDAVAGVPNSGSDLTVKPINAIAKAVIENEENKVDKEEGKGLSTNDYTDEEQEKVAKNAEDVETLKGKVETINEELEKKATSDVYVLQEGTDFETDGNGVITRMLKNDYEGKIITFPKDIRKVSIPKFGNFDVGYTPFVCKKIILPDNVLEFRGNDVDGEIDTGNVEIFVLNYDSGYYIEGANINSRPSNLSFGKNIRSISMGSASGDDSTITRIRFNETPLNRVEIKCSYDAPADSERINIDLRNIDNYNLDLSSRNDSVEFKILGYVGTYAEEYAKENDISFVNVGSNFTPQILANTVKGKVSGTAFNLDDISPIEDRLDVRVSGVDDYEAVTLYKAGKNLLDASKPYGETSGSQTTITGNTVKIVKGATGNAPSIIYDLGDYKRFVGTKLVLSFNLDSLGGTSEDSTNTQFQVMITNGNSRIVSVVNNIFVGNYTAEFIGKTIAIPVDVIPQEEYKTLTVRFYMNYGKVEGDYLTISNVQLEINNSATEYEPYKKPIACVVGYFGDGIVGEEEENASGTISTIEGVKPIYPNTTLYTDTEGAIITCEYNRDINRVIADIEKAILSLGGNV